MPIEMMPPHNWCDRRCERCPLSDRCPIPTSDPSFEEALGKALELLEEELLAQGYTREEIAALPPRPPPPLESQVVREAAFAWFAAIERFRDRIDEIQPVVAVMKVGRILGYLEDVDDELLEMDTAPNLVLLERQLDGVRADVERIRASTRPDVIAAFDERDRVLRGLLAPLLALIQPRHRALIATLAAAGMAPSPFAVKPGYSEPCTPSTTGRRSRDEAS